MEINLNKKPLKLVKLVTCELSSIRFVNANYAKIFPEIKT